MKKTMQIIHIRWSMLKNCIYMLLKNTPALISLILIVPVIFFLVIKLALSDGLQNLSLNPDINLFLESFKAIFHQLLYYSIIIVAPLYILISQINVKSYDKYKNLHLSFQDITIANIICSLLIFDVFIIFFLLFMLIETLSMWYSIFLLIFISVIMINCIFFTLLLFYTIISNYISKFIGKFNITIIEFIIAIPSTFIIMTPIKNMPLYIIMNTSSIMIYLSSFLCMIVNYS